MKVFISQNMHHLLHVQKGFAVCFVIGHLVKANCIYRFFDVVLNTTHFYPSVILV